MALSLQNKTALITGASGGIGEAIAVALHAAGAQVILSGTREAALNELAGKLGERAHIVPANLSDSESVKQLAANAEKISGRVDILINNAGITKDGLMLRMSEDDFAQVLQVNLMAVFSLSKLLMRGMMKERWGRIISIGSIVGTMGNPGQANYAASKAGVEALMKSIAKEVASRGITANTIAPGFISTNMTDKLTEDQKKAMMSAIPMGSFGTPEDVAGAAVFLSSDASRYITGHTIHVNGGMLMV